MMPRIVDELYYWLFVMLSGAGVFGDDPEWLRPDNIKKQPCPRGGIDE